MRAELPWNVAGIPPEAREAARAAARREGLSVGEWLTRRILRSFSDQSDDIPASSYDRSFERNPPLDAWGLPPSAASHRYPEDMLSRREEESSEAFRRVEDHLRSVTRRLDSAERSQSENNRAMSKTAAEINIASREQAQAFDQLGGHVVGIGTRLERLERSSAQEGVKDAVKALHQGLSRLADQISQTASQSASQVTTISGNLEQMAGRLGQVRSEAQSAIGQVRSEMENTIGQVRSEGESTSSRLEARISQIEDESRDRFAAFEAETQRTLDQRLAAVEKASQINTDALDHALERLEAQADTRAGDQVELQKRHAETGNALSRIDETLEKLDARTSDPQMDRRLDSIERALGTLVGRLETYDPAAPLEDALRGLTRRIDAVERNHDELVDELRANLAGGGEPAGAAIEPPYDAALFETKIFETKDFEPKDFEPNSFDPKSFDNGSFAESFTPEDHFETPPFAEQPHEFHDAPAFAPETPQPDEADPFAAASSVVADPSVADPFVDDPFAADHSIADPFAADPSVDAPFAADLFATDPPVADSVAAEAFTPSSEDTAHAAADENFLAIARRSAQAAAADAEASRGSRLNFSFGPSTADDSTSKERSKLTLPLIIAIVLVLALYAGVTLSQRLKASHTAAAPKIATPAQAPKNNTPFTPAPQVIPSPAQQDGTRLPPPDIAPAAVIPPPQAKLPPAQPESQAAAPAKAQGAPQPFAPAPKGNPVPTLDRITQLANSGNATAETILGLKELDGDGVPANTTDAAKWLERAAQQGQAVAQYRLGAVYERGQGVQANPATAVHWYQLAANQGNRKAMHNLAVAFASGTAGKKDMAEAARWFSKAADLGLADSQFNLAVLYERGDGAPQSLLDAYKWYAIAANQGDAESKTRLSVISNQLSDDDRDAAQKSAATFHAAPLNRAANVPPEMADLSAN